MIAAVPRCAALRGASLRIAPQLNAPLGSLEPLLRLWDAEGHQAASLLDFALRNSSHRAAA
jgi:hypothetical protein